MPDPVISKMQRATFTPQSLSLKIDPKNYKLFSKMTVAQKATVTLHEPLTGDAVYTYKGKKFALPHFRLLPEGSSTIPGQQGLRFSKDDGKLHLNIIVEVFRDEIDVLPMDYRKVEIFFSYSKEGNDISIPLRIVKSVAVNKVNVSRHIYAHTLVDDTDKKAILNALTEVNTLAQFNITAEIWWQIEPQNPPKEPHDPRPKSPQLEPKAFNPLHLRVRGTSVYLDKQVFLRFRNPRDATKAVKTIGHYRMNHICRISPDFFFFLSGNRAPIGTMGGEDAIGFNPKNLRIKNINANWTIVDGNHALYAFGNNRDQAQQAFEAIKKYGFDTTCYIGRPNPGMIYLKRKKAAPLKMINLFKPKLRTDVHFDAKIIKAAPIRDRSLKATKPQKFELKATIISKGYSKDDTTVFQGFFDDLIAANYKWEKGSKKSDSDNELHTYHFRLTNDPNQVFFLPQVYRIGVDTVTGEPRIQLNLYKKSKDTGGEELRIRASFFMVPYFHPRAKKDLMSDLDSKYQLKYVKNLVLKGYKNVQFKLSQHLLQGENLYQEKFTESLSEIDPTTGFYIEADHSLESFDHFKKEMLGAGISVGKIIFDLEEEIEGLTVINKSNPIDVELNLRKLENIPLAIDKIDKEFGGITLITGFELFNKTDFPVDIEGVELTVLSKLENVIHDVDSELKTEIPIDQWPIQLAGKTALSINLDNEDDRQDLKTGKIWTDLICEPFGVQALIDPERIMASVIDRATGERDIWNLEINCPIYSQAESWTEEALLPYAHIAGIQVLIKVEGEPVRSVILNMDNPKEILQMSRSASQLLNTSNTKNRSYSYQIINITASKPEESDEWITSQNESIDELLVYPNI